MSLLNIYRKVLSLLGRLLVTPIIWRMPKKCDILIYDDGGANALLPYLTKYQVEILPVTGKEKFLLCVLLLPITSYFWNRKISLAYFDIFIKLTSPKLIVTAVDNSVGFYFISNRYPAIKTIFVQNGWRSKSGDVFADLVPSESYCVDYILVFNQAIGQYYKKYMTCEVVVAGSIKNNHIIKSNNTDQNEVLFISQYRKRKANDSILFNNAIGEPVIWDQYYDVEKIIIRFLRKWCKANDKHLTICGFQEGKGKDEQAWYAQLLSGSKWGYIPRSSVYNSYYLLDRAELVVVIDSTLGYESLGRGKKTAFFSCRGNSINDDSLRFGWPLHLPDNGDFWTTHIDENAFSKIMNYLKDINDNDWQNTLNHYVDDLMVYDPGNKRFQMLIEQLLSK